MADDAPSYPIFEVPYLRLFPWLRLFHAPGAAADPKRLMLALAGLVAFSFGENLIESTFPGSSTWQWQLGDLHSEGGVDSGFNGMKRLLQPAAVVVNPFVLGFTHDVTGPARIGAALAALWALVVWTIFGGAIARIAVLHVGRGERLGMVAALRFVGRKLPVLLGTPLLPLAGVALFGGGLALFGLLYRLPGTTGATIAGFLAFLPLLGGLVLTLIVTGLALGWPLMTASVAAEDDDAFDAMSRSYAYVRQRPWHYLGYGLVALGAGLLGLWFVEIFAKLVLNLTTWGLGLGGGSDAVFNHFGPYIPGTSLPGNAEIGPSSLATRAHGVWVGLVLQFVEAWAFSLFWTVAATVYLLLRKEVDGTPIGLVAAPADAPPPLLAEAAAGGGKTLIVPGFAKPGAGEAPTTAPVDPETLPSVLPDPTTPA